MKGRLPIVLRGTGAYTPKEILTNQHFVDYLDTTDEWITTRTGIRERRKAAPDESTSTLGAEAARRALDNAGLSIDDIDIIVCATATGDHMFPATACFIQHQLGGKNIPAFDVGGACAGFMYATITASGLMLTGAYNRALVIGAETLTRFANAQDRSTCILFGDAGGAAIFERSDDPDRGIIYFELGVEGSRANDIILPAGGSKMPASQTTVAENLHTLHMKGREVYKFAVVKMVELIERALHETGLTCADLKMLIPHQSNLRIIESVRERIGLPIEKVAINIDRFGNTSAPSVVLSLDEHRRSGLLVEGDTILLIAIGAGLAWGTMVMRL